jgi:hypothetical protein
MQYDNSIIVCVSSYVELMIYFVVRLLVWSMHHLRLRDEAFLFEHVLDIRISATKFPEEFVGRLGVPGRIHILANPLGHLRIEDVAGFLEGRIDIGVQHLGP